jgi:hypothetical protein
MIANNFEIFFFTMTAGLVGLAIFFIGRMLLNFFNLRESHLRQKPVSTDNLSKRHGKNYVPTLTCSLPIHTQKRVQQRLW